MSIAPVQSFPPDRSNQPETTSVHVQPTAARTALKPEEESTQSSQSVSGTVPQPEKPVAKNVSAPYVLPQDEVQLHQDPENKNQIIIQYLDPSKNVILQVPSNAELDLEHGIAQELQEAVKLRASEDTAAVVSEGEKSHGD